MPKERSAPSCAQPAAGRLSILMSKGGLDGTKDKVDIYRNNK